MAERSRGVFPHSYGSDDVSLLDGAVESGGLALWNSGYYKLIIILPSFLSPWLPLYDDADTAHGEFVDITATGNRSELLLHPQPHPYFSSSQEESAGACVYSVLIPPV